jgi:hypothetical protein
MVNLNALPLHDFLFFSNIFEVLLTVVNSRPTSSADIIGVNSYYIIWPWYN